MILIFALPLMVHNTSGSKTVAGEADITMRQAITLAFGHRSYVLLVSGFFVCGFQLSFILVHMPPYLPNTASARNSPDSPSAPSAFSTWWALMFRGSSAENIQSGFR